MHIRRVRPPRTVGLVKKHFGKDVKEFECRYLGVLDGTGKADAHAPALPESQLAFEWGLQTKDGNETHPVTMKCKQAWDRQRINLPKRPVPLGELERAARKAMGDKRDLKTAPGYEQKLVWINRCF